MMSLEEVVAEISAHSPYTILHPALETAGGYYITLARPLPMASDRPGTHLATQITISKDELRRSEYPLNLIYSLTQEAVRYLSADAGEIGLADKDKEEPPC